MYYMDYLMQSSNLTWYVLIFYPSADFSEGRSGGHVFSSL